MCMRHRSYDERLIYHCAVQLKLRLNGGTKASAARMLSFGGLDVPVNVTRHRLARRYVVRVAEDGSLRLTVPRGASIAGGFAFAERQAEWIRREIERQRQRCAPWVTGTKAWFRGEQIAISVDGQRAMVGQEVIALDAKGTDVRRAVEAWFRGLAAAELPERCRELAKTAGLTVSRVSVRDQRSRWGACSARRVITLNWRLVQMPRSVRDYVIFHELMHIRHPNHSRRFWGEVAGVCTWWKEAERWLRSHGRELLP
jgi:predicted metal-dependent hydrolase